MVKTYVPQELIDTYNKGKGIDQKEYEYITSSKKLPTWMNIPKNSLTPDMADLGPPEMADFSGLAAPFDGGSLVPQGTAPPLPIAPPPLPVPPPPPLPAPSSVPVPAMVQSGVPPLPSAITGM